jgi:hypothetical protein
MSDPEPVAPGLRVGRGLKLPQCEAEAWREVDALIAEFRLLFHGNVEGERRGAPSAAIRC